MRERVRPVDARGPVARGRDDAGRAVVWCLLAADPGSAAMKARILGWFWLAFVVGLMVLGAQTWCEPEARQKRDAADGGGPPVAPDLQLLRPEVGQ